MDNTTNPTPYAHLADSYHLGMLQSFIEFMPSRDLPGIEFESGALRMVFQAYLNSELERIRKEAERFAREG
jgi:hypothetical protein